MNTCRTSPGTGVQVQAAGAVPRIGRRRGRDRRAKASTAARSCRRADRPAAGGGTARHRPPAPAGRPWRTGRPRPRAPPCADRPPGRPRAAARHQGRHGQARQAGRRGVQTSAPSSISACAKSPARVAWRRASRGQRAQLAAAPPAAASRSPRSGQHPLDIGVDRRPQPARRRSPPPPPPCRGRCPAGPAARRGRAAACRRGAPRPPARRHAASGRAGSSPGPARHAARRRAGPRPALGQGREAGQERLETPAHGRDGGLLQHQLADQHVPGVGPLAGRRAPRQVAPRADRTRPAARRAAPRPAVPLVATQEHGHGSYGGCR